MATLLQKKIGGFDPIMEGKVKVKQTRDYRPTRFGSVYLEIARECLTKGNLTPAYMASFLTPIKARNFVNSKEFAEIKKEFDELQKFDWSWWKD